MALDFNDTYKNDFTIGKNSKIWHFCNVYGCKIGDYTQIGSYTEIKPRAVIGNYCRLQSYVFIPEETIIGNYVFIAPRVTFLNDKYPSAKKTFDGSFNIEGVVVGDEVTIGGGAVIMAGVRIGKGAFIGAGSIVTKDVPPYTLVYGNPAKKMGDVKRELKERSKQE